MTYKAFHKLVEPLGLCCLSHHSLIPATLASLLFVAHTRRYYLQIFALALPSVCNAHYLYICLANFLTSFKSLLKSYLSWLPHLEVLFPSHPGFPSMLYLFFCSNILLSLAVEGKLHEGSKFCLFYLLICPWHLGYLWLIISAQ